MKAKQILDAYNSRLSVVIAPTTRPDKFTPESETSESLHGIVDDIIFKKIESFFLIEC